MLLDRLPAASAYRAAVLDDPEVAAALVAAPAPAGPPPAPSLVEFSTEVALLTVIADRLGDVTAQLVASAGHKPPRIPQLPRPVTGVDRARAAMDRMRHESLVDEVKEAQARWAATRANTTLE